MPEQGRRVPPEPTGPGPGAITGVDVVLVPVRGDRVDDVLAGDLDGRAAGRGWPHPDTPPALAFATTGGATWLVVDETGAVVGEIGTKAPPDASGRVEIGYGLAGPSRGRGLGGRALSALLDRLDTDQEVEVVVAHVAPANEPSIRLLRRYGFHLIGSVAGEDVYERPRPL
jgi:ribosomal protein S18 acetylase RimI-like enzyme